MKITAIQKQKNKEDRYSIFIDGEYHISLSESELIANGLRQGQVLGGKDLEHFRNISKIGKALDSAYNYLSFRSRSIKEVNDFLVGKYDDKNVVETAIQILCDKGYLNDKNFASSWVSSRQLLKPRSLQQLKVELAQKGISSEVAGEVLSPLKPYQVDAIMKLIVQKRLRSRYNDNHKLIQYLAGQGFRYGEIKQALEELA